MQNDILFISDLDGTLLNPDAALPSGAAERINRLTRDGVRITFATARTVRSVAKILGDIDFHNPGCAPVALMNGTMVRDMAEGTYVTFERFEPEAFGQIFRVLDSFSAEPFVYTVDPSDPVDGDPLMTSYRRIANPWMKKFRDERIEKYGKPFRLFSSPDELTGEAVYLCLLGAGDFIAQVAEGLRAVEGIRLTYYPDNYEPGLWYLEISPRTASKKHAVEFLRAYTGCAKVAAFGDNRNDLPMFEAADIAVAVKNASDEVKAAADDVTGDVVGWIEEYVGISEY